MSNNISFGSQNFRDLYVQSYKLREQLNQNPDLLSKQDTEYVNAAYNTIVTLNDQMTKVPKKDVFEQLPETTTELPEENLPRQILGLAQKAFQAVKSGDFDKNDINHASRSLFLTDLNSPVYLDSTDMISTDTYPVPESLAEKFDTIKSHASQTTSKLLKALALAVPVLIGISDVTMDTLPPYREEPVMIQVSGNTQTDLNKMMDKMTGLWSDDVGLGDVKGIIENQNSSPAEKEIAQAFKTLLQAKNRAGETPLINKAELQGIIEAQGAPQSVSQLVSRINAQASQYQPKFPDNPQLTSEYALVQFLNNEFHAFDDDDSGYYLEKDEILLAASYIGEEETAKYLNTLLSPKNEDRNIDYKTILPNQYPGLAYADSENHGTFCGDCDVKLDFKDLAIILNEIENGRSLEEIYTQRLHAHEIVTVEE